MNIPIKNSMPYFNDSPYACSLESSIVFVQGDEVLLDRTIFYPAGGGQPGDTGILTLEDGRKLQVVDTTRDEKHPDLIWHRIESAKGAVQLGQKIICDLHWDRRYRHMRMHTCLHLLCSLIDAPVTGCSISEDKGRLDFDLADPIDKITVTEKLNSLINQELVVRHFYTKSEELMRASKIFRPESASPPVHKGVVRMIEIAGVDLQPCRGTHVKNTKEIGLVTCSRIQKKSRTNRRFTLLFE